MRARAKRCGRAVSILLCDIDYFKQVNDRFCHHGVDVALIETGLRPRTDLRAQDEAARWGGEEVLVLLPETDRSGAMVAADKLRECVRAHLVLLAGDRAAVSTTIGVACWKASKASIAWSYVPTARSTLANARGVIG